MVILKVRIAGTETLIGQVGVDLFGLATIGSGQACINVFQPLSLPLSIFLSVHLSSLDLIIAPRGHVRCTL